MISVREVASEEIAGLGRFWNRLLSSSGSDGLFLTWEWVSTWLQVFGGQFEPLLLIAEEDRQPCGIAPLMIRRGTNPLSQLSRTLMFIGQEVDVTPDYLDLIVPRGQEWRVVPPLVRTLTTRLAHRWDFVDLDSQLRSSPTRRPLLHGFGEAGIELDVIGEDVSPYVELPSSWEAFLQSRSGGFRKQYKNKLNRLQRAGAVRLLLGGRDLSVEEALEHIVRLNRERWQETGRSFRSQRYLRFHRMLCAKLAPLGRVALLLMELDGEVVAGRDDFVYGDKLWCYQGGWSPAHRELNLGDNMLAAIIQWGIQRGLREYDFLGGRAAYKDRWATARRELQELRGTSRSGRAQLLGLLRQARDLLGRDVATRALAGLRATMRWPLHCRLVH
jgi:CelD/BcsL family acetyltransferase involved in cellulose biosynthesis